MKLEPASRTVASPQEATRRTYLGRLVVSVYPFVLTKVSLSDRNCREKIMTMRVATKRAGLLVGAVAKQAWQWLQLVSFFLRSACPRRPRPLPRQQLFCGRPFHVILVAHLQRNSPENVAYTCTGKTCIPRSGSVVPKAVGVLPPGPLLATWNTMWALETARRGDQLSQRMPISLGLSR